MVMKDYLGRDLLQQPSEEELEKRRKSTMSKKYEEYIYEQNFYFGGWQTKYRFENGYGASVVNHNGSYGLELGIMWYDERNFPDEFPRDIVPYISSEERLDELLRRIKGGFWVEWED